MTTAEYYRQLEKSPAIDIARFIFNHLSSDCTHTTLGSVVSEIKTGKTPSKQEKRFYEDAFLNWFKPEEIGSSKYLEVANDKLSRFAIETNQATVYEPDTLLINAIGDVGRVSILKSKSSSNQQITGIRFSKSVDIEYAYYYLLANRKYFYVDLFKTTLPIVNQKRINSIPFFYPSISKQKEIIAGLRKLELIKSTSDLHLINTLTWDEEYSKISRRIFQMHFSKSELEKELIHQQDLAKQLRQAFLREAMQGKLVKQDKKDGHAKDLLAEIKAEKIKAGKKEKPLPPIKPKDIPFEIPESWVWCRLGEISTKVTDGFHNTPAKLSSGRIYISATHIRETGVKWNECVYVSEKEHRELYKKAYPQKGEILITNRGAGCGTPAIIDIEDEFSFQNAALIGFDQTLIYNKFVFYFFWSSRTTIMQTFVNGGLQPMLSNVVLRTIPFPLPPIKEQYRIVDKLEELINLCNDLEQNVFSSQLYNDKLLQQILKETLHPDVEISTKRKQVKLDIVQTDEEKRDLLGGYLINQADLKKGFGHLKFIKHMVMAEYFSETEMPTAYHQHKNGPYDKAFMQQWAYRLKKNEWFEEYKVGKGFGYKPLAKAQEIGELFEQVFAEKKEKIDFVVRLMNKTTSDQAEIIATVYAVWNDLLINQMKVNETEIKKFFFKWSDHKKNAFTPKQVVDCYNWMIKQGLIPKGTGKAIMNLY